MWLQKSGLQLCALHALRGTNLGGSGKAKNLAVGGVAITIILCRCVRSLRLPARCSRQSSSSMRSTPCWPRARPTVRWQLQLSHALSIVLLAMPQDTAMLATGTQQLLADYWMPDLGMLRD